MLTLAPKKIPAEAGFVSREQCQRSDLVMAGLKCCRLSDRDAACVALSSFQWNEN
jgi:hypothetical protein